MWREAPLLFSSKREYIYIISSISSPPRNGFVLDLFDFGGPYVGYAMTRESFHPSLRTLQAARHPLLSSPEHVKHLHKLIEGCGWEDWTWEVLSIQHCTPRRVCIYVLRWERIKPRTGRAGKKNLSILDRNSIQSDGRSFQFPDDEDSKMGWFLGWMRSSSKWFLDWPYGPYMAKVFISIWDMPKSKMRF